MLFLNYIFLVLFSIFIHKIESINSNVSLDVFPNWVGSFYTTAQCDIDKCCCIYGLVVLSKIKPNYLQIQGELYGYNCPSEHIFNTRIDMPTGFKTEIMLMGGLVSLTLSDDSRIITLYNLNVPSCSGQAIRNDASSIINVKYLNIILTFGTLFIAKRKQYS